MLIVILLMVLALSMTTLAIGLICVVISNLLIAIKDRKVILVVFNFIIIMGIVARVGLIIIGY